MCDKLQNNFRENCPERLSIETEKSFMYILFSNHFSFNSKTSYFLCKTDKTFFIKQFLLLQRRESRENFNISLDEEEIRLCTANFVILLLLKKTQHFSF